MSKQVIVHWTPSPSEDVARQELTLIVNPDSESSQQYGPLQLAPTASLWSTKETGQPLSESDEIEVSIATIDKGGLRDTNPPTRRFALPNVPPASASDITFEVRDYDDNTFPPGPTGPVGPTGP